MQLHWHRRNLQPSPNPALSTALTTAKRNDSCVVPLFVLDTAIFLRGENPAVYGVDESFALVCTSEREAF
jgi:deoxyribodipyrimidine photo-lyase